MSIRAQINVHPNAYAPVPTQVQIVAADPKDSTFITIVNKDEESMEKNVLSPAICEQCQKPI